MKALTRRSLLANSIAVGLGSSAVAKAADAAAEAMIEVGMQKETLALIESYWGGMVTAGADTFWEVYDPADSRVSSYGDVHVNSFCHAWNCTPAYFFRTNDDALLRAAA